jgi:hypothetical protein
MKIVVAGGVAKAGVELDVSGADVELVGVYNGVGIQTEQGLFGVCQRDGGIEVLLNGHTVWSSVHGLPDAQGDRG